MPLPDEFLDMSLRNVVAATGRPHPRDTPCDVATVVAALNALEARIESEDAAWRAECAAWLAGELGTSAVELDD